MQQTPSLNITKYCWFRISKCDDGELKGRKKTESEDVEATVYESCEHTFSWQSLKTISMLTSWPRAICFRQRRLSENVRDALIKWTLSISLPSIGKDFSLTCLLIVAAVTTAVIAKGVVVNVMVGPNQKNKFNFVNLPMSALKRFNDWQIVELLFCFSSKKNENFEVFHILLSMKNSSFSWNARQL